MYLPFWKVFFFSVWYYITYGENLLMIRLETHCHTRYSKDSLLLHSLLYMKCRLCHIDAIAICEHNNILGALKFKEYCSKRKNKVFVIVGEEIMTSSGEIIGLYLNEEIPAGLSCDETIDRIISQGGVVYVPHPYDEKRSKTVLSEDCISNNSYRIDCIECYNGRNVDENYGIQQTRIADKYGLVKVVGSDAHTLMEIGRNYMEVKSVPLNSSEFRDVIKNCTFHAKPCIKLAHKGTRVVKLIKMIVKGNFNEIYRVINRKIKK